MNTKRNIFEEIKEGLEALAEEAKRSNRVFVTGIQRIPSGPSHDVTVEKQ